MVAVIYCRGYIGSPGITFASAKPTIDEAFAQVQVSSICDRWVAGPVVIFTQGREGEMKQRAG